MNIRVDLKTNIADGSEVVFRSPADCSQVTGLAICHNGGRTEFAFADAHGNNVGDIDHLFAENAVVKVILDVTAGMAFVQNADTNAYIERTFVKTINGQAPDESGNVNVNNLSDYFVEENTEGPSQKEVFNGWESSGHRAVTTDSSGGPYFIGTFADQTRFAHISMLPGKKYEVTATNITGQYKAIRCVVFAEEWENIKYSTTSSRVDGLSVPTATAYLKTTNVPENISFTYDNTNGYKTLVLYFGFSDTQVGSVSVKEITEAGGAAEMRLAPDIKITAENLHGKMVEDTVIEDAYGVEKITDFIRAEKLVYLSTTSDGKMFAKKGTSAIYTTYFIDLLPGASYLIRTKNANRLQVCLFDKAAKDIMVANNDVTTETVTEANATISADVFLNDNTVSTYKGAYKNAGNHKCMALYVRYGGSCSISVKETISGKDGSYKLDDSIRIDEGNIVPDSEMERMLKVAKEAEFGLRESIVRANQARTASEAERGVIAVALSYLKHRNEFVYGDGTCLDNMWNFWSAEGAVDINTGDAYTSKNAGYKLMDCSTFALLCSRGIDYYSSYYYNTLENSYIEQGALTNGVNTASDNPKVWRTGKMPIRPNVPHISEVADANYLKFATIYAYDKDDIVVGTFTGGTFATPATARYLRAELLFGSKASDKPSISVSYAVKCVRIRENVQPSWAVTIPERNSFDICEYLESEKGYEMNINYDRFNADDIPAGALVFFSSKDIEGRYKSITHVTVCVGNKMVMHGTSRRQVPGKAIQIDYIDDLINGNPGGSYNLVSICKQDFHN